jgi:lipopolysaccharide exporter
VEEKVVRGVPWTLVEYIANKTLTLATTLVLARLLVPSDFGLVALAMLTIQSVQYAVGLGIAPALVISPDLDRRVRGTALTLMAGIGAASTVLVAAASPLIADVFNEDRLAGVLVALSATLFIGSLGSFYAIVMQADLAFRPRFAAAAAQTAVYAVVALTLASLDGGVWSLVAGQLAGYSTFAIAGFWLSRERTRPNLDRRLSRDLLARGKGFFLQGGLTFVQENTDYVTVGRILGAGPLGLYTMSFRLSEIPYNAFADPIAQVTFPGFARVRHRGEELRGPFLTSLRLVALAACPLGVILAACADPFVNAVMGERWLGMIAPLSVLGVWGSLRAVEIMFAWLLNSVGEAWTVGKASGAVLLVLIPAMVFAADTGGLTAVAWVMTGNVVTFLVVMSVLTHRRLGIPIRDQWASLRPVAIATAGAWLAARGAAEATADIAPAAGLVVSAGAGAAAYVALIALVAPGSFDFVMRQLRRSLARDPRLGTT